MKIPKPAAFNLAALAVLTFMGWKHWDWANLEFWWDVTAGLATCLAVLAVFQAFAYLHRPARLPNDPKNGETRT